MATIKGGGKLEKALREIARELNTAGTLRVGFLEGATYPADDKTTLRSKYKKRKSIQGAIKGKKGGLPVAAVAAFQEFGTSRGIPPRPFFRNMIADKSKEWPDAIRDQLKINNYDTATTLRAVGEGIRGQLIQSIRDTNSPPLAPATIKAKGFSKPLIDTSHMIKSVDFEVQTKK